MRNWVSSGVAAARDETPRNKMKLNEGFRAIKTKLPPPWQPAIQLLMCAEELILTLNISWCKGKDPIGEEAKI